MSQVVRKFSNITRWMSLVVLAISTAQLPSRATALDIQLYDFLDTFGEQVAALQAVNTGSGLDYSLGIYDTGASVTTISKDDQSFLGLPVKCAGCAEAEAIDGTLVGNVGFAQTFLVDGLHNINFDVFDPFGGYSFVTPGNALSVPGIQAFIGTTSSANLPSIAGMPTHQGGNTAARIDMKGSAYSEEELLGELFAELGFGAIDLTGYATVQPDLYFVAPNSTLPAGSGNITNPFVIDLANFGDNNSAAPGDDPSVFYNPVIPGVTIAHDASSGGPIPDSVTTGPKTMLFDTGAQLSIISTDLALELGLDLNNPDFTNPVQGAAGSPITLNGYFLDSLNIPVQGGDSLHFLNAPVFVLDIGGGLDGIIGMNLFNTANQMLFDPFNSSGHPTLSVTFDTDPERGLSGGLGLEGLLGDLGDLEAQFAELAELLAELFGEDSELIDAFLSSLDSLFPFGNAMGLSVPNLPGFNLEPAAASSGGSADAVPEPASTSLGLLLFGGLLIRRRRVRR